MTQVTIIGRGKAGRALAAALNLPNVPHSETVESGAVILAVPDRAVASVAQPYLGRCCHLSGSLHLDEVPAAHPLVSFDGHPADWTGTPLATTGAVPSEILAVLTQLGFVPFALAPEAKARYHAAAVLTSGHASTLWIGANRLLQEVGVTLPGRGFAPLIETTLKNYVHHGPAGRTGPFVRGDIATIERDADALPEAWREIFLKLGYALDDA